jgi:glutamyl-tRNA reductase
MPIVVIGLSHHSASVEVRERFAYAEAGIDLALAQLIDSQLAEEAVILSTCNRVELYAVTPRDDEATLSALREFLCHGRAEGGVPPGAIYHHAEPESVEHLFRVACGLDSMVLGETEILGQLKHAYDLALRAKRTGGRLNKAFQKAFNVAKYIRTETRIQRGSVSVANVAVDMAEKIFATLKGRHVMVIGAGDTSEKTAKALLSRGASQLTVANRTLERAQALAESLGGAAISLGDLERVFPTLDIVVSSTSAPHYVLSRASLAPLMARRGHSPLLLIDIAVPRDIDPEVNLLENVYLYNIDDLQGIANDCLQQRREEVARCEAIIREKAKGLLASPPRPASGEGALAFDTH